MSVADRTGLGATADAPPAQPAGPRRSSYIKRLQRAAWRGVVGHGSRPTADQLHRLVRAERRGLELAILCRTAVFFIALVWYAGSLWASGSAPTAQGIAALVFLTGLGVLHYLVIGTKWDRPWLKYVMVTIDLAAICAIFVFVPVSRSGDVPQIYAFRTSSAGVLMPFIALATLSLSPRLTLWAGVAAAGLWLASFRYVALGVENAVSWSDMPVGANRAEYEAVFLSPGFIGSGTRYTEVIVLVLVAIILAIAVARARRVFFAQVQAEAQSAAERTRRAEITERLGRFVPAAVAERLIKDPSGLAPQVRDGAALVMDVEGFTTYAEGRDPAEVIAELNSFLARCADAVNRNQGVVIAFTGDGLLATFNTPLELEHAERAAVDAARSLVACGATHGFRLRVGIAAGPIAAGSIGSSERQAFTVYGNTVNRAARLEALAKDLGEVILADRASAEACETKDAMEPVGDFRLPGLSDRVTVFRTRAPTSPRS